MKGLVLTAYPQGLPSDQNFAVRELPKPEVPEGAYLVRLLYVSVDPYLRGRMNPGRKSYVPPFQLEEPISGFTVGEVVESKNPDFPVGAFVSGSSPFTEFVLGSSIQYASKVEVEKDQLSHSLGVLGMPGITAYFGFLDICQPKAGETVVVSGASGAVGSYVIQLAKIHGCTVIGIAGSEEKTKVITEQLKGDFAINYKTENVLEKLKEYAPKGVDMYFDNVGGDITDAVFAVLNRKGRVAVCGSISSYNNVIADVGPRQWGPIIVKSLKVQGFIVFSDYGARWQEGVAGMTKHFKAGEIVAKETFVEGFEQIPKAFINLFTGANVGKQVVRL